MRQTTMAKPADVTRTWYLDTLEVCVCVQLKK